jgi:superfamily II DNA or RNA helicase
MIYINRSRNSPFYFLSGILPSNIADAIDGDTSDFVQDYDKTTKFINGDWDGKFHLFQRTKTGNWYFPVGMLPKVKTVLDFFGEKYQIQVYDFSKDNQIKNVVFNWQGPEMRDYQVDALMELYRSPGSAGTVAIPTGAGKTMIALRYAYALNASFIVLVHRKELLWQWSEEIKTNLGVEPATIGAGEITGSVERAPCVVAMVQTLASWLKGKRFASQDSLQRFKLLVIDEAHTIPAQFAYRVAMSINTPYRMGLTATPRREDGLELKLFGAAGGIVRNITVEELVNKGYLARPVFRFIESKYPETAPKGRDFEDAYRAGIVANRERNQKIADIAFELAQSGRQVYIHVARISHGTTILRLIEGIYRLNQCTDPRVKFVHGNTTTRKADIADYTAGKYPILVSTLLKEGVNIPRMDALIYAAGRKSGTATIQTIGRALRPSPGKNDAIIVDFIDFGNYHLSEHSRARIETMRETYGALMDRDV